MHSPVCNITVIGLGLIGGSLSLAFKAARGTAVRITAVDSDPAVLTTAMELGVVDQVSGDLAAGVVDADLIFLCTPVLQIVPLMQKIAPHLKAGAIVSDVGSTKGYVMTGIEQLLPDGCFYVAGHPMAGRERSGVKAANASLFQDKWYILVPAEQTSTQALQRVREVIGWTGARITVMDVLNHDWCTAVISHLPHVAAAAMVNLLDEAAGPDGVSCGPLYQQLAGGGFRDTTRIASSNPDMWADVCLTNGDAISENLERFQGILTRVIGQIRAGDRRSLHEFFASAQQRRDSLETAGQAAVSTPNNN